MSDGSTICVGIIVVIIGIALFVAFPVQMFLITTTILIFYGIYKFAQKRTHEKKERIRAFKKANDLYEIVIKINDKDIHEFYEKTLDTFRKGKITLGLDKIKQLEEMIKNFKIKQLENLQKSKGLVKYVSPEGEEKWGKPEDVKSWKEIDLGLKDNFSKMSGYEFEKFISNLFEKMGYEVEDIKNSGDNGVDIMALKGKTRLAIQVKRWLKGPVGNDTIQKILGAMLTEKATRCMVITTSGFTGQALEQAEKSEKIELWNKEKLHDMVRKYLM